MVGERAPEAWEKGPLAYVRNGDMIEIDINQMRLQVLVTEQELARRQQQPLKRPDHPAPGMLAAYRKMVTGAEQGAVWL